MLYDKVLLQRVFRIGLETQSFKQVNNLISNNKFLKPRPSWVSSP